MLGIFNERTMYALSRSVVRKERRAKQVCDAKVCGEAAVIDGKLS